MESKSGSRPESPEKIERINNSRQAEEKDAAQIAEIMNLLRKNKISAMDVMQERAKEEDKNNHDVAGAIERVKGHPHDLARLKPAFRDNEEVVIAAVIADGSALKHASARQCKNPRVAWAALGKDTSCRDFISPKLILEDAGIACRIYSHDLNKWEELPENYRNISFCIKLLEINGRLLEIMPPEIQDNDNAVLAAICQWPEAFQFASKRLRGDKTFIAKAMKEMLINNNNKSHVLFIHTDKSVFKDEEFLYKMVKMNPGVALYIPRKLLKEARFILALGRTMPELVASAGSKLKADPVFMMEVIKLNAANMKWASPEIKRDREFIKKAVVESPGIVAHIADELKKDRAFILVLLDINGLVFRYLDPHRKYHHDKEMAIRALKNNPRALNDMTHWPDFMFELRSLGGLKR